MNKHILLASLALVPAAAFAQQSEPSLETMACIGKLNAEIQDDLQLRVTVLQLQKQVQNLEDQLKKAKK